MSHIDEPTDSPSQPGSSRTFQITIAVTGTNGKTSVVEFVRQLLAISGRRAASWGTMGLVTSEGRNPNPTLAVGQDTLSLLLDDLSVQGIDSVAFEAYSTALDRGALDELPVDVAAFTNLNQDHLDYHGSVAAYAAAKRKLFELSLSPDGTGVVNADDEHTVSFQQACELRGIDCLSFGNGQCADVQLVEYSPLRGGSQVTLSIQGHECTIELQLVGRMMVENILCAATVALAVGMAPEEIVDGLPTLQAPIGRVERITTIRGADVYVDYAHTPTALTAVLHALREQVGEDGRLGVVFGCGGERDREKRFKMGQIATQLADFAIVTDDNPRSENPAAIRRAILAGCPDGTEIPDRHEAIRSGLDGLSRGDVLVVAGKGHEEIQRVGRSEISFADREVVKSLVTSSTSPSDSLSNS